MEFSRFLLLSALLAGVSSSPVAGQAGRRDETLSFQPGGPIIWATESGSGAVQSVNPGGPMTPASIATATISPGGLIIPATISVKDSTLPFNPGGLMIPTPSASSMTLVPGGPMSPPTKRDTTLSFNPGGPMVTALPPSGTAPTPMTVDPGGPMVPASSQSPAPSSSRHRSHKPHTAQPSQTPLSVSPGGPTKPPTAGRLVVPYLEVPAITPTATFPHPVPPIKGCTTTLSVKVTSPCSWDGIETLYPYTTTLYRQINCHGCQSVDVHRDIWFCPNMRINDTEKVSTPSTYWSTVCEPLTALSQLTETDTPATITSDGPVVTGMPNPAPTPLITALPEPSVTSEVGSRPRNARSPQNSNVGVQPTAACPTTFMVSPGQSAGRTLTRYSKFTTTTIQLDCGGCPLVTSTAIAGYGPIGRFTATITLPLGTVTAYACL